MSDSLTINAVRLGSAAFASDAPAKTATPAATMPNAPLRPPANVGTAATLVGLTPPGASSSLRILTLNIQLDAHDGKSVPGIVAIVRSARADVVGLQEVGDSGPEIARQLGFHYVKVGDDTAVLSRYPLVAPEPDKHIVTILLGDGRKARLLDLHLAYAPYQPYQLLKIPYDRGRFIDTEAEAIDEAWSTRGAQVNSALAELRAAQTDTPTIVVGDFNQPSFLDWTAKAAAAKRHPIKVMWPETKAFADAGYNDAYRAIYADEMEHPGMTWTPTTSPSDPSDHHDRLDFVLYNGPKIAPITAEVVGENAANADLVVDNYATDHRGVVVEFRIDP